MGLLLVAGCWLFVVCCLLFVVVCCLLFVVCCLLFVVCCLLFVVCCLLFVCSLVEKKKEGRGGKLQVYMLEHASHTTRIVNSGDRCILRVRGIQKVPCVRPNKSISR